jgi:hypothetical protein
MKNLSSNRLLIKEAKRNWTNKFIHSDHIGKSTSIIFDRKNHDPSVLQHCNINNWTELRHLLADLAKTNEFLISTYSIFSLDKEIYIKSQLADICLADIISCSLPVTEEHASAILTQVCMLLNRFDTSNT